VASSRTHSASSAGGVGHQRRAARQLGCLRRMISSGRPSNGRRPVSASYSIAPTEYQSLAGSRGTSAACSGDMYAGVPTAARSWV
jgi:hypothetical protein